MRAKVALPVGMTLGPPLSGAIALSPDSRKVAMIVGPPEKTALAVHDLTTGETRTLAGTEMASFPFWSPDSRQIGFFAQGKLKTIDPGRGVVQIVCDAPAGRGGSWSPRGVILFAPDVDKPLFKVSEGGGTRVQVTRAPKPQWSHRFPLFLPDGETFLYILREGAAMDPGALYAGSIAGNLEKRIADHASNLSYADGRLLFILNGNLVAQQFDAGKLAVDGPPIPIAEAVEYSNRRDLGNFSATGRTVLYVPAAAAPRQFVAVDPKTGQAEPIGRPGEYKLVDVSRDGKKAAVTVGESSDIWVMQLDRGIPTRATFTNASYVTALLSPDGNRLAFGASTGRVELKIAALDGGGSETILQTEVPPVFGSWSADGRQIVVSINRVVTGGDVESLSVREHRLTPILHGAANETEPVLSPDDKWLAYVSNESCAAQIYVTSFPAARGKWQVSSDGGTTPQWTRDGRRLYFVSRGKLNVVEMRGGASPDFSLPTALPVSVERQIVFKPGYAPLPDGRILTTRPAGETVPQSIHIIANWTQLLPH